jgi:hypothetical protein
MPLQRAMIIARTTESGEEVLADGMGCARS